MPTPTVPVAKAPDRRRRSRLRLAYRLRLTLPGEPMVVTKTEDISCEGFFCITESALAPGQILECELAIPADERERTAEPDMVLRCRAEVVRVVPRADRATFGVACRLWDYTVGYRNVGDSV